MDPEVFMPLAEFTERLGALFDQTKAGERAAGVGEILIPGERELRAREQSIALGVPLSRRTLRALLDYAQKAGLRTNLA